MKPAPSFLAMVLSPFHEGLWAGERTSVVADAPLGDRFEPSPASDRPRRLDEIGWLSLLWEPAGAAPVAGLVR